MAKTGQRTGGGGRSGYGLFGYNGSAFASLNRLQTVDGLGSFSPRAGEEVQRYARTQLLGLSRKFMRDNAIYQGVVRKSVGYVVGKGFKVQARTPDPKWNSQAEKLWGAWWAQPDVTGARSGLDVLRALCAELMVTGEAWALLTSRGTVQLLEAEQVAGDTPADNGVVKDASGGVTDYMVRSWDRMGTQLAPVKVKAGFVATAQHLDRPSCERGVPVGQAVFAMLHRVNDVLDSEALSWQMISRIALAWMSQQEVDPNTGEAIVGDPAANPLDQIFEGDFALVARGIPGDDIRAIDRNIPGKDFPQSVRMYLRLIGVPFGIPLEFILLDWTGGNYTQGRAVMEQTYAGFEGVQALIKRVLSKIYVWKLGEWVRMGLLPRSEYWAAHEIFTPSWPWLDQLKEIQAATESVEAGLCTHTETLARLNKDREEFLVIQERETVEAIEIAKRVEAATGVKVDWKIFAGRMAGKTEAAVNAASPPTEPNAETGTETDAEQEEGGTDED